VTAGLESIDQSVRAALEALGPGERGRFVEERERSLAEGLRAGPLLDQLCCVRLVMSRLQEGYTRALADFEERLDRRAAMGEGWRRSTARKVKGEYESPMPWLHPFRLAREDLEPLEAELQRAVVEGSRNGPDPARLGEVLARHGLGLPLPSPLMGPRFPPGAKPEI